ncbi:MAG TPA: hypothetical protein DD490_05695, partial [Acidobacteria bacterium]|nr:hypothetical protein [Acidobacteriota bacterium]
VGMAGRFPGARDLGAFWENLQQGAESVTFFSAEELAAAGIDPDELADPHYVRAAPVLDGIELFDAEHFGFNPREAQVLDPQIRLFLECTWEAIEQAGYDPAACPGRVGVYAGMRMSDYLIHHVYANPEILQTVGYFQAVLGNDKDYLATLTSYKLNLTGPSLTVQSACSTSLVAIHQASEALANRECDLAVAGGVTIRLPQTSGYHYHPQGIFSPDGHCRAFEARAAGTVFGNGVGVVLLKRLEDARRDGDPVLAVIRGSAVNNDGSQKVGYTAPAVAGQARVIADALAMAGVEPAEIGYVECHGTGTALGDPIEIAALDRVFRAAPGGRACPIGSVKSNVGHLEAAAGVASFIKAVLMLKHRVRVPLAGFEAPNPRLGLDRSAFRIDTASAPWETDGGAPRRAGVSSFGIGGTNAHVVLEEAPPREASGPSRPYQLLVVSARTATALDRAGADLAAFLRQAGDVPLADVAYTLQTGRHAFSHRRIVVASGAAEAAEIFTGGAAGRLFSGSVTGAAPGVAFLFPGQGSQHVRMAEDLYRSEPVFRGEVDACCEILAPRLGCDLRTVLFPAGGEAAAQEELRQTRLAQPALFVVEHALARLLLAWGVEPQGMLGHSVGEYVAACLAGVFSRDDALALVAERGRLVQHMPPGGMLAVGLSEAAIAPSLGPGLDLAAVNGPELVTVAGPEEALAGLEGRLRAEGTDCRRLHTSHAFHSAMLEPILDLFAAAVRRVALRPPERPFLSNVTGTWI